MSTEKPKTISEVFSEAYDLGYATGQRMVRVLLLGNLLSELLDEDLTDEEQVLVKLGYKVKERELAVAALRGVCAEHGDNEWPDDGALADVIEKHLGRHLRAQRGVRS